MRSRVSMQPVTGLAAPHRAAAARLRSDLDGVRIRAALGGAGRPAADWLPFAAGDCTAGVENEWQAVVVGNRRDVDLPRAIADSATCRNLVKRVASGDLPAAALRDLQAFLDENTTGVWENSWATFPRSVLSPYARAVFETDLLADKTDPTGPLRQDAGRFVQGVDADARLRLPVSYLLKLALAEAASREDWFHRAQGGFCAKLMGHFSNDNTSPETYSFAPVRAGAGRTLGAAAADETLRRFLLAQCLAGFANQAFRLQGTGQRVMVYCAPTTPVRQRRLNDLIPDQLYRDLFMSPCLSGWDRGEEKHQYMALCHQVLSRSRLNAIGKLREAGILNRNLVVMPNLSNTSLANNGTHISLGSGRLTALLAAGDGGYTAADEKCVGDLVIKVVEHFLPLFVGTLTAAPQRIGFEDFHPEIVLGYLPHELDFTHLRMMWRRWKKKAALRFLGSRLTPVGPRGLDRALGRLAGLRGDVVPDFRLVDYLVSPLSTDDSPALDGQPDNDLRLRAELAEMGVFDARMSHYTLYRLRRHAAMGFSGFEGRHYSVFTNLRRDAAAAADLQALLTALAFQYVLEGQVTHDDIPDTPGVESERRQAVFGAALDLPTFYVGKETRNRFLAGLVTETARTRWSRRYPAYTRVTLPEYRLALLRRVRRDGAALIEAMGAGPALDELEARIRAPSARGPAAELMAGAARLCGCRRPMQADADTFNTALDRYYREDLRAQNVVEACEVAEEDVREPAFLERHGPAAYRITGGEEPAAWLHAQRAGLAAQSHAADTWQKLVQLLVLTVEYRHGPNPSIP